MFSQKGRSYFFLIVFVWFYCSITYAGNPIFNIQLKPGQNNFPGNVGLHDVPEERLITVTNQSSVDMPGMLYQPPLNFIINDTNSTCGSTLQKGSSCVLAVKFIPAKLGHFNGKLKVCGGNGLWCSVMLTAFDITVTINHIIITDTGTSQPRPFASLDYNSSLQYAQNFSFLLKQILNAQPTHGEFSYIQHIPSANETTIPCLEAVQKNVGLNPNIKGGGDPLCNLMGFATSNADANSIPRISKLFPPYLNFLAATAFPITGSTIPASSADLNALLTQFGSTNTDGLVRDLGYMGYVDFLNGYYQQQLSKSYQDCGLSVTCPSIFYLPYQLTSGQTVLETWPTPTSMHYWGISGGGGSGAGFQIQAFKPGTATHYTLFSGGGGGGAGNTTPEAVSLNTLFALINVGSGGGGGSQFADCYVKNNVNYNGLGLGAGTGSGLSTNQGSNVIFTQPPAVDYSYYAPVSNPSWSDQVILENYVQNMGYLFNNLIPFLYDQGYTITITGGGGGGTGLEFLDAAGNEFQPHPLSIGYGFNFCYAFNKTHQFNPKDCIPSENIGKTSETINNLVYQNIGALFNQATEKAILPENCNGYQNYTCNCKFQNAYVICQLGSILKDNGFTSADIPTWLTNPHCNTNSRSLIEGAILVDHFQQKYSQVKTSSCQTAMQQFIQAKTNGVCAPPWGLTSRV